MVETDATLSGSIRREKTPTPCQYHGVVSVLRGMKSNDAPDLKTSGTTDASTAREAVLSWAEQQSWIRERATRARQHPPDAPELLPMTTVSTFGGFLNELHRLIDTKENPDEWYIVSGKHVGTYSIQNAETPDDVPDDHSELPPEAQQETENVEGFYQIGTLGWSEVAFDEDVQFVSQAGFSDSVDVIDRRVEGLLLVHESALSDQALEIAHRKQESEPEVGA